MPSRILRQRNPPGLWLGLVSFLGLVGCTAAGINLQSAREVTREQLVEIADSGPAGHLRYMGTEGHYHYVHSGRPNAERTYKVRANRLQLADTFAVGDDQYVLHPWVIEGKLLGSKPE